jgi:DNA-binding CsgD family transcriptional regulator
MLSEPFPSQRLQLSNQQVETWRQIDPRENALLSKKLMRASREAAREIEKQTREIRIANRLVDNVIGTELRVVKMWGEKINRLVETDYAIFFKEWQEVQGNKKTAIFVRATSAHLLRMIGHWGSSKAHEARNLHHRRGGIGKSLEGFYTELTRKLREDWKEKLDIEAQELGKQEAGQRRRGLQLSGDLVRPHPPAQHSLSSSIVPIAVTHQDATTIDPQSDSTSTPPIHLQAQSPVADATADIKTPAPKLPPKKHDLSRYLEVANLTPKQHECASLKWEYEFTVTEIARRQHITRKTVDEHLAAAQKRMGTSRLSEKHARNKAKSGIR